MTRIFGRLFRVINHSWQMYPIGFLFGLGFDTASEVALLAISAGAAANGLPFGAVIALPLIFAAGMSLMDTADGAFMAKAYSWAFASPIRKVFYNLTMTSLSVFVALFVGVVELLQVLIHALDLKGGVFGAIAGFDLVGRAGYLHRRRVRAGVGGRAVDLQSAPHRRALGGASRRGRLARTDQAVDADRVAAEHRVSLVGVEVADGVPQRIDHLRVGRGEQADRPVGAEHASLGPEPFQGAAHVWLEIVRRPRRPRRLGDHPGQLAADVRALGERRHRALPFRSTWSGGDAGLRDVVDDEAHVGQPAHHLERGGQLAGAHQQVVDEAGLADRLDAALDVLAQEPFLVRLVVDLVADADQVPARPGRRAARRCVLADGGVGEVDPTDDAGDEVGGRCGGEELAGLVEARDASGRRSSCRRRSPSAAARRSSGPNGLRIAIELARHPVVIAPRSDPRSGGGRRPPSSWRRRVVSQQAFRP